MSSTATATARPPVNTRFFTRRVIFACAHTAERIYPIRDLRGPSFKTACPPVPMLLALRLPDTCIPCARAAVYDRYRENAAEVRETMAALQARLDRILKKADADADKELLLESDETAADEAWPDAPPAVASLVEHARNDDGGYYSSDESAAAASGTDSDATVRPPKPRPVGKLSVNIRLLREDLERRMQAWNRKEAKASKADANAALSLSSVDLEEISGYEAFETHVLNFTAL